MHLGSFTLWEYGKKGIAELFGEVLVCHAGATAACMPLRTRCSSVCVALIPCCYICGVAFAVSD